MKPNLLIRLLQDNRTQAPRAEAPVVVVADDVATIYLYQAIVSDALEAEWWGGICAATLVPQIDAITAPKIRVRIDCPGGDVFAATAIAAALRNHKAEVTCSVDGVAASAATTIAIAGNRLEMADGTFFMVHRSWTIAWGNANDLLSTAALLEKVDGSIAGQYARKTGDPVDEMLALMDAETWMTAEEAVERGFADGIATAPDVAAKAWNLAAYAKAPAATQERKAPAESPAANAIEIAARLERSRARMRLANVRGR